MNANGTLYGTTGIGGHSAAGTIFRLSPPNIPGGVWTERVLYSFPASNGGLPNPTGLVLGSGGVLYGATHNLGQFDSGTVYQLTPPAAGGLWTESVIHSFSGGDGEFPVGALILDGTGTIYGATSNGGPFGAGVVFSLSPPEVEGSSWAETVLHAFALGGDDGAVPVAGLIIDSAGALYGTTIYGGGECGMEHACGTVFKLSPPTTADGVWSESILHAFAAGTDGEFPMASVSLSGTNLYGSTSQGGTGNCSTVGLSGCGTIFQIQD